MSRFRSAAFLGKFAISLLIIVVVQGILAFRFRVFTYFDLPLIFCVYYGFTLSRPTTSIVVGSVLGLMQDSLSGAPMGTNGFSKTVIGFLAASSGSKFNVDQTIARTIALILFTLGDAFIVKILSVAIGPADAGAFGGSFGGVLLSAVFNTLFGLVMFGYHDRFSDATT